KNTVVEASYIGNHALHIERGLDWNDVLPSGRPAVAQAIRANDPNANDLINSNRRLPGISSIFLAEGSGIPAIMHYRSGVTDASQTAWLFRLPTHGATRLQTFRFHSIAALQIPSTTILTVATRTLTGGRCLLRTRCTSCQLSRS